MRRIRIEPLLKDENQNFASGWRRQTQILASILFWAKDAGVDTIEFDPGLDEPFAYRSAGGNIIATEMGPTPREHVDTLPQLIRDVADGHPAARPIRRAMRSLFRLPYEAILDVPGYDDASASIWHLRISGDRATFTRTD